MPVLWKVLSMDIKLRNYYFRRDLCFSIPPVHTGDFMEEERTQHSAEMTRPGRTNNGLSTHDALVPPSSSSDLMNSELLYSLCIWQFTIKIKLSPLYVFCLIFYTTLFDIDALFFGGK
ncbi:hypothetical protein EDB86DRAFT_3084918 [Lactarius hatsudake]|nr:hypothetical protein EDB86DRAFT_3084918 [Lactarius hatsudake]